MSNEELDLFSDQPTERRRPVRKPVSKPKKRRTMLWVSMAVVLVLIGVGGYYGLRSILDIGSYEDFSGAGKDDVVVRVESGNSTGDIAATLAEAGVVASSRAFVNAAEADERVIGIQPGYYVMKSEASGAEAVKRIVDPESRVGNIQIPPGSTLHDITKTDGAVEPGIVNRLAAASCADLNGKSTCVPVEELRAVADTADLAALGAPDWAIPNAAAAEPARRLEGLVLPGVYDVRPGSTAEELWKQLVTDSATQLQVLGWPDAAADTGYTPYQVLTMASLVEREAIKIDFGKVSRVTYNRLRDGMELQYDSTINYVQNEPTIRTNSEDRERPGPYNSYLNTGLPPTPISSPSKEALAAAVAPEAGEWLFFVRCETNGMSCFATTNDEHEANVDLAQERGAY
jgi:UPF0755 protein